MLLVKYFNNCFSSKNDFLLGRMLTISIRRKMTEDSSRQVFHRYKPVIDVPPGLFRGVSDRFNGITVDSNEEFVKGENFFEKLEKSLCFWKENNRRTIWFKVHTGNSHWVPHLTKKGFDFHHAKNGFVVMYKWLPLNESANIPEYAHTMIGVGGLVVNENNEILVISEKNSIIPGSYKLPGGYVEPKENLIDAVIREVKEETGVETKFETVVSLRHSHGGMFGCSDIYIVIGLSPITSNLVRCEREIAKVEWMPIDTYLNHPNVHQANRQFLKLFLDYKTLGIEIDCETKIHEILKKQFNLYFIKNQSR